MQPFSCFNGLFTQRSSEIEQILRSSPFPQGRMGKAITGQGVTASFILRPPLRTCRFTAPPFLYSAQGLVCWEEETNNKLTCYGNCELWKGTTWNFSSIFSQWRASAIPSFSLGEFCQQTRSSLSLTTVKLCGLPNQGGIWHYPLLSATFHKDFIWKTSDFPH